MDLQVRLSLQGGHVWEFCCDEDDPIVFGLVSALPGAYAGGNLPADGLIQVEAKSGERLFLTPSSLVSVELIPIVDDMTFRGVRRLTASATSLPGGSTPSPFVLTPDILPSDGRKALVEHALSQEDSPTGTLNGGQGGVRELGFGSLEQTLVKAFDFHLAKSRAALAVSDPGEAHIHCRLFAINDGGAVTLDMNGDDLLCFVYHIHKQPKKFAGGGVRLFDGRVDEGARRAITGFRDLEVDDNALLTFPGHVVSAGLPVRCATRAFADGLFVICGALRRGPAA
jgi:hypothetical protein